jgi:hypothetical protein
MAINLILRGGLGNQLFQYAALRAHTLRTKTQLIIDLRYYDPCGSEFDKKPWLKDFPVNAKFISYQSSKNALSFQSRLLRRLITERQKVRYQSTTIGFDPDLQNVSDRGVVTGLFQSPRHFESEWSSLERELDLVKQGTIVPEGYYIGFPLNNYVAVHVRRGDYLSNL